ncbi:hypothetical protein J1N35_041425 [Gossypium stocksii]|uniref:phosphopyruvate hydratase n=1 Tax=Gossypium stocksii TaxID=47602 RepID=A0A9D3UFT7_9ROSI|nr:hypothetical protein J1N35_041425 [Gossypium stocksii]
MAVTIASVKARQIFDSRGNPTVEVDVETSNGKKVRAAVPSGASTGIYEALELRDGGSAYLGKGVSKAVANVNTIIGPALIGKDPTEQTAIDNFMVQQLDGTQNEWGWCKQKFAKLELKSRTYPFTSILLINLSGNKKLVLRVPAFNVINGGSHAGNKLAMQEFMILPVGASSFKEAMKMGLEVYHHLKAVIKKKYGQDATNVGDEGGFTPNIQVVIGMDVTASKFYGTDKTYDLNFKEERVEKAIKDKTCNARTRLAMRFFSSGETDDTFIADLSVGLATGQINMGAPCRSERLAKYNQILRIEEELGAEAVYAGASFRAPVEPY